MSGPSGDSGNETDPDTDNVDPNTLWGWLSGIFDKLKSVAEGIISLPQLIIDGIKRIFIPDPEVIKEQINNLTAEVEHSLGLSSDTLDNLKNVTEQPISDIEDNYKFYGVGTLKLKFFDTSALKEGVEEFRPLIRGFTVLMLILFIIRQFMSFIGQDPQIMASAQMKAENHINSKGDK